MTTDTLLTEAADMLVTLAVHVPSPLSTVYWQKANDLASRLRVRGAKAEGLDAARLDWVDKHGRAISHGIGYHGAPDAWFVTDASHVTTGYPTIREAVDAAILATKPGDGESRG